MRFIQALRDGFSRTIVTYGTSLTEGGAWVQDLGDYFNRHFPGKVTVVNAGKSSMNSAWGLENLKERVISKAPHLVLIEFSINDAWEASQMPWEVSLQNHRKMIQMIQQHLKDCEILLLTMNPPSSRHPDKRRDLEKYYGLYHGLADGDLIRLIDIFPEWDRLRKEHPEQFEAYLPDGIHPSPEGSLNVTAKKIRSFFDVFLMER